MAEHVVCMITDRWPNDLYWQKWQTEGTDLQCVLHYKQSIMFFGCILPFKSDTMLYSLDLDMAENISASKTP
jgi:hypothetical protein